MRSLLSIRIFAVVVATGLFALSCSDGPVLQYDIPGSDNGSDVAGDTIPPKDILPDNQEDRIGEDIGIDLIGVDTNVPDSNGDTGPLPREFGYPCLDNTDCNSGYCVEDVNGLVCSRRCNNDCPDDWSCRTVIVVGDPVTLCMPSGVFLCRSCVKNSQCADGLCLPYEEGNFCSRSCSEYSACPDGYDCVEATDPETSRKSTQCIPSNGTCTCRLKNDTEQRPCSKDNEAGTCLGFQTCNLATGWSECSAAEPTAEICDGLDNDCNRISDDNPELPVGDCFNTVDGIGSCRGEWLCRGQDGWDCFGPIPAAETCNYLDDNCDGSTDEDFKVDGKYVSEENCGQCGVGCDGLIPFAKTTSCDPGINPEDVPQCVVEECIQGYLKAGPQLCRPAISSLCVPCEQDSNCGSEVNKCIQFESGKYCGRDCSPDGIYGPECPGGYQCSDVAGSMQCVPISGTCECTQANHGIKRICEIVNEFGTCQGNEVCDGAVGWVNCSARVPADEICDAIDNDCNGLVDDDPIQPPDPCEKSWTDPVSGTEYTCGGTWSCQDTPSGKEWVCPAKMPSAEVCNAIDDNCNGETDEDFKLAGTNKYNNYDHCGACNVSCAGLVQNAVMKCDATGPQPVCLVDYCNEGWWKASDLSCQRFPESQCLACSSDASCQIPGDVCIPADSVGNTYCMWDCSEDALRPELDPDRKTCPEGYYCRETNDLGQPLFKCFPQSNSCDCLAANAGHVRACVISNSFGRCFGDQTCQPATGWTVCNAQTPSVEICNNNDDDCNGLIDEPFPSVGSTCTAGIGECLGTGNIVCNAVGDGVECTAVAGEPVSEICDLKDNDCDNSVDEDFPDYGKVCFVGTGECLASGTYVCQAGGLGVECNAVQGTPVDETCDDRDNDCDGSVDEDYLLKGRVCAVGVGECFANGVWICSADQSGLACDAIEGLAGQELCDGLDNDCDLEIDELWPERETVCVVGQGACRATGVFRCMADMSGIECSVVAGTPSPEICDGIDNDCDGSIDEDWADLGRACQEGVGECLANGVWTCTADLSGVECSANPGTPVAELCDGKDNDCDGSIDEDWTNKGTACQEGVGECLANGVIVCTADLSGVECSANPGTPVAELCDGLDNDCDGSIDEDWTNKGFACQEGVGECLDTGVIVCTADLSGVECNANPGTPVAELCDGLDNNCNGSIDETWTDKGRPCNEGVGACLDTGVWVCTADFSGIECSANPGTAVAELCDGIDNDCDGSIDETWTNKGRACQEGVGECFDTGVWVCTADQSGIECDAEPGAPVVELCDGLDNDCDGSIDEDWTNKGTACQEGVGECLANGVWTCMADLSGVECSANPGTPVAELCDGKDNDCDGGIDEDWTNKGTACQEGVGECLANGVIVCMADLSGVECSANPGTPVAELCDGLDNDCDGSIDETWTNKGFACQEGVGECLDTGVIVCTADQSGVECNANPGTPVAELCDGLDNNCNGSIDETWTNKGTDCREGIGACSDTGVWVCSADLGGVECSAEPGDPVAELCDDIDNDCDGSIDEEWVNLARACQEGVGECLATGVWTCTADLSDVECSANPGTPVAELCDGLDNDCDGSIDEDWTNKGTACQEGVGECLANGVIVCTADLSGVECNANPGTPVAELCDGLDNDCDGSIDETWTNKGFACQEGVGECLDTGVIVCTADQSGVECNANPGAPVAELCDGLDNNCNGSIDETWTNKGRACQEGVGECLDTGVWVCTADQTGIECDAEPGLPVAEQCDGLDNDCDGSIDETWTNKGTACQEGVGECLASGVWTCTADLSGVECSANPGTPVAELCDGKDNDCDGSIDEDWTNKGTACQEGVGECLANGVWLCTADLSGVECSANPGTPVAEL
ncbi:MAG TPA: MopE-related protein, partial [Myxococcota bacterium]|nr:MopE-related protein [Myxococcota bacterium]